MKFLSRRDFLKLSGIGAAALALTACGSDTTNTESTATTDTGTTAAESQAAALEELEAQNNEELIATDDTPVEEDGYIRELFTVCSADPGTLPPYSPNMDGRGVLNSIYDPLFDTPSFGADPFPVVADATKGNGEYGGYDHEAGTGTYIVYIHDNVYDSDGNNLTADDIVFMYDNYFQQGASIKRFISCEKVDDYSIKFEFEKELVELSEFGGDFLLFCYTQKGYEDAGNQLTTTACGSGKYKLSEFVTGSYLELELKDEAYWQTDESLVGKNQYAGVKKLHVDFITEAAQKVIGLETGSIEMVESLDTQYVDEFRNDDRYQVYTYRDNLTKNILFNCSSDSLCGDLNMRLALSWAINIDGLLMAMGDGYGSRAYCMGNANFSDYNPEWETWDNYNTHTGSVDASVVQGYLDAAGYNGEELTVICQPAMQDPVTVLLAQWLSYGINVKISALDSSALTTTKADSTAWDMSFDQAASKGYIVSIWGGSNYNPSAISTGVSTGFNTTEGDPELCDALNAPLTVEGHTKENIDAAWQAIVDRCLCIGLYSAYANMILPADMTTVCLNGKKWPIFTACHFEQK